MLRYARVIAVSLPLPSREELERQYQEHIDVYDKLLFELQRRFRSAIKNCGLRATIKYRVKSFESYYAKLLRSARRLSEEQIEITDIIALRVVCPFLEDVALAERCVRSQFVVREIERKGAEFSAREFGYQSVHCLIAVPDDLLESFHLPAPFECEVQIRTILQDAWAEVEHELVYKADFTPFEDSVQRKLAALNANLSLSDITFQEIREYQRRLQDQLQTRRTGFWSLISERLGEPHAADGNADILGDDGGTFGVDPNLSQQADDPGEPRQKGAQTEWPVSSGGLDSLLLEALQAHNHGEYERAIEVYSSILASAPRAFVRAIVHMHRGIAFMASDRNEEALADFSAALALDPDNLRPRFLRGTAYRMTGELELAERDFSDCLDTDPYRVECLYQRAALYEQLGRLEDAAIDCERALRIEPEHAAAAHLLHRLTEGRNG